MGFWQNIVAWGVVIIGCILLIIVVGLVTYGVIDLSVRVAAPAVSNGVTAIGNTVPQVTPRPIPPTPIPTATPVPAPTQAPPPPGNNPPPQPGTLIAAVNGMGFNTVADFKSRFGLSIPDSDLKPCPGEPNCVAVTRPGNSFQINNTAGKQVDGWVVGASKPGIPPGLHKVEGFTIRLAHLR